MLDFLGVMWNSLWGLLLNILVAINSVVHIPAVSIIIFTIFIRLLTVPLTMKALRSSRNMQAVQPKIKAIQKEYGKDRAKVQEETMKLYSEYGINPAAGCFPMLIQLPIFFGLYSALDFTLKGNLGTAEQIAAHTAQLKSILWNPGWFDAGAADFSGSFGWVTNLSAADPLFIWPVLSGFFQFIQSRMAMPRRDPNNPLDPQMKMMNGLMQFMPIYIIFISLTFPAGTVIYWAFSSLFGAVQQFFITGFGSLPDLPGLGFLPRKEFVPPQPPPRLEGGAAPKKGMMNRMMEKALEAQETQKAAQAEGGATSETKSNGNAPRLEKGTAGDGASVTRYASSARTPKKSGSSAPKVRHTSSSIAGNGTSNGNGSSNGSGNGFRTDESAPVASAPLPRKKRSKR